MARWHFEAPDRRDLIAGWGVNANVRLRFTLAASYPELPDEEGEPLRFYKPDVEVSWSSTGFDPERAVAAARLHMDAAESSCGVVHFMKGRCGSNDQAWPSRKLTPEEVENLEVVISNRKKMEEIAAEVKA